VKTVVTGSEGFIGSHLVERLVADGVSVRAFVQYNSTNNWGWLESLPPSILESVEVVTGDVRDPFVVRESLRGCNRVYHLAALIAIPYSYRAPLEYVQTNVIGTLNVLQAAHDEGVERVIQTSTSEVYGTARRVPIDEDHPLQGQSPYSASKIGADKLAESFHLSFNLPVVTVRPFNTYGPRQSARAVIPTVISQVLWLETVKLGSLHPIRDLTFVADTVDGFIRAGNKGEAVGRTINLCQGKGISIGDLAELILELMGSKKEILCDDARIRPEASEVQRLIGDNTVAREILGWTAATELRAGLSATIEWVSAHKSYFKTHLYNV
jgi:NAD dependent epimerase/dehydratase